MTIHTKPDALTLLQVRYAVPILVMEKIYGWVADDSFVWRDREGNVKALLSTQTFPDISTLDVALDVAQKVRLFNDRAMTCLTNENFVGQPRWGIFRFREGDCLQGEIEFQGSCLPKLLIAASLIVKDPTLATHPALEDYRIAP